MLHPNRRAREETPRGARHLNGRPFARRRSLGRLNMPLPRVAYVSSGAARPPAASNGYDPTQAAKLTRNMRGDATKDDMGSLLFPEQPNQVSRMPVPASNVALPGTSVDHPLRVAGVVAVNRPPEVAERLRPSGANPLPPQHTAGQLRARGESAYSVIRTRTLTLALTLTLTLALTLILTPTLTLQLTLTLTQQ